MVKINRSHQESPRISISEINEEQWWLARPTPLVEYEPAQKRTPTPHEVKLLHWAVGHRQCSSLIIDRLIDLYLIAGVGTILFVLLSLDTVEAYLTVIIPSTWARLAFKALIIFIVLYLLDRFLARWRERHVLCPVDG